MEVSDGFVSRAWLAGIPFTGCAFLIGMAGDASLTHPGFFLCLSAIALLICVYGWTINRPGIAEADLKRQMRLLVQLLAGVSAASVAILLTVGATGSAVLIAVVGLVLSTACWPSGWTLRRREKDLSRPYKGEYLALALITGVGFSFLAAFSIVDSLFVSRRPINASDTSLVAFPLAFAASGFIQAWDERRRQRQNLAGMPPSSGRPR